MPRIVKPRAKAKPHLNSNQNVGPTNSAHIGLTLTNNTRLEFFV